MASSIYYWLGLFTASHSKILNFHISVDWLFKWLLRGLSTVHSPLFNSLAQCSHAVGNNVYHPLGLFICLFSAILSGSNINLLFCFISWHFQNLLGHEMRILNPNRLKLSLEMLKFSVEAFSKRMKRLTRNVECQAGRNKNLFVCFMYKGINNARRSSSRWR